MTMLEATIAGGGDRIVLRASPIVGQQRVAAALERRLEIGTLGGEIARPQPVALLETEDRRALGREAPRQRRPGRARSDHEDVDAVLSGLWAQDGTRR
jgi:hypothetical protein